MALFTTVFPGLLLGLVGYYKYILPKRQPKRGRKELNVWSEEEEHLPFCAPNIVDKLSLDNLVKGDILDS